MICPKMKILLPLIFFLFAIFELATPVSQNHVNIVGGHNITIEEAPYQVSVQYHGSHSCGGSIISSTRIVTAAHCTMSVVASDLSIRAGTTIREVGGQVVGVSEIYNHPNFSIVPTIDYDIAVLALESPLDLGDSVSPIVLPEENQTWAAGTEVLVSGWGLMHETDLELATILQGVVVEIIDAETCKRDYSDAQITSRMVCAGVDGGGKDACTADSGGPLAASGVLAGVVSWGNGCGNAGYPGVYANVAALRSFIDQNI